MPDASDPQNGRSGVDAHNAANPELEALLRRTVEIASLCDAPGVARKTRDSGLPHGRRR
jgi:hypothetical protein